MEGVEMTVSIAAKNFREKVRKSIMPLSVVLLVLSTVITVLLAAIVMMPDLTGNEMKSSSGILKCAALAIFAVFLIVMGFYIYNVVIPMITIEKKLFAAQDDGGRERLRKKNESTFVRKPFFNVYTELMSLIDDNATKADREYSLAMLKKQAEIKALQNQINPHFLYNTLDTIKWEARIRQVPRIAVLAENLAALFGRPVWDVSMYVNVDAAALIGADTLKDGQVVFREGPVCACARLGGFGVLDEVNMAKNEALAVLHATLDHRRVIDVPGYERIQLDDAARFIGTMNYGYAGTRELNEALVSRFVVVDMPVISDENLQKLLRRSFPTLKREWAEQLTALFRDLRTKCDSSEISTKALDLRGLLAALHLIEKGIPSGQALDLGIINKAFEPFERQLVADAVWARLPRDATRDKLFD